MGFLIDLSDPQTGGSLRDYGKLLIAIRERSIVLELGLFGQWDPMRGLPLTVSGANKDLDATLPLVTRLGEAIQVLSTSAPHVIETFEALVVLCQGGRKASTADEVAVVIIL